MSNAALEALKELRETLNCTETDRGNKFGDLIYMISDPDKLITEFIDAAIIEAEKEESLLDWIAAQGSEFSSYPLIDQHEHVVCVLGVNCSGSGPTFPDALCAAITDQKENDDN